MKSSPLTPEHIRQVHQLYCQLTGQSLSLGFDRERMWYELLRLGYGLQQVQNVIRYLQREIRHGRRNVGALKLSNLLQPDRFEEDLNISTVQLHLKKPIPPVPVPQTTIDPQTQQLGRKRALDYLHQLKRQLHEPSPEQSANTSPAQSDKTRLFPADQFDKIPTE
jgi:hypothetical protein